MADRTKPISSNGHQHEPLIETAMRKDREWQAPPYSADHTADDNHSRKDFWHVRKSVDIVYIAIVIAVAALGWVYGVSTRLSADEARSQQFHQDLNQRLDQMESQLNYLVEKQQKNGANP